jgi:signal peptidase I
MKARRRPLLIGLASIVAVLVIAYTVLALVAPVRSALLTAVPQLGGIVPGSHVNRFNGPSMEPTIHTGQYVVVQDYGSATPQRGDIAIFHPPNAPQQLFVQRVIAIPGDSIALTETDVILNGVKLNEPYVAPENAGNEVTLNLTLQPAQYFVMGDNRRNSQDSHSFGPVPLANFIGKVIAIRG